MLKSLYCSLPRFPRPGQTRLSTLPAPSRRGRAAAFRREAHLYGDIKHEPRLSCVGHAHHPDPIGVAHAHLLWKQRKKLSTPHLIK